MTIYQRASGFIQSAWLESKKVTWPTRQELTESTRVVIVASFVVMIYLFVVDRILTLFLNFFYR
jgi:preprotein translocase SecE subunit